MTQTIIKPALLDQAPPKMVPHHKRWQRAVELILVFPLMLLMLEGVLNVAGVGQEEFLQPDPVLGVKHIPGKKVVWRLEGYSDESFSSAGLRDTEHTVAKPDGVFRIALLGDSATEGMQVPLPDTYGKQLELILNNKNAVKGKKVEVINFGCSSYSNGQEMLQLQHEALRYSPDLVVLMYNRGDFVENIRDPRTLKAEPRPYFYRSATGELQQDNAVMEANKNIFEPKPISEFLRNNSRIYGILSHLNLALSLNEPLYAKIKGTLTKKIDRAGAAAAANYRQTYPIQDVWQVTESIIQKTRVMCQSRGIKFMVACFPNIVCDKDYTAQIKRIGELSKETNFGFVDLTYIYMYSKDPKGLFLKYHFSSAGHRLAAESIEQQSRQLLAGN